MCATSKTSAVKKHPGGRPPVTLANLPENWKDIVIVLSAQGYSDEEIRAELSLIKSGKGKRAKVVGFNHVIWYALKEREAQFAETIKIGHMLCYAWWKAQARKNINNSFFNAALWFMNMKNRFAWKDKVDIDHSGAIGLYEKYKGLSVPELNERYRSLIGSQN